MWNLNNSNKDTKSQGFIHQGNVDVFLFTREKQRVTPLFCAVGSGDVWTQPVELWEHNIKEITGIRFFSTTVCPGRDRCQLCAENRTARENGVSENKFLPYPVRKRYVIPVWHYQMNRVLYLVAAQSFFEDMIVYIEQNSEADFEIWKTGVGFETRYRLLHIPDTRLTKQERDELLKTLRPSQIDLTDNEETLRKKTIGKAEILDNNTMSEQNDAEDVFCLPFGQEKGKTLSQLHQEGKDKLIEFYAEHATGRVQEESRRWLETHE